jgi:hypothetical protein
VNHFVRSFCAVLFAAAFTVGGAVLSAPAENAGALSALKLVPQDKAANVARIVGRDGTPAPERWYFVTYDAAEQNGLREYVVAKGELVAARPISQFASQVTAADVIGVEGVKVDSKRAGEIAADYARANNAALSTLNYELLREGAEAAPVWKVTCIDGAGKQLGVVTMTASHGAVILHDGFPIEPKPVVVEKKIEKLDTYAEEKVAPTAKPSQPADEETKKTAQRKRRSGEEEGGPKHAFKKIGGKLQKFFTGRDTISD